MTKIDSGVLKELILGFVGAALCFAAPVVIEHTFTTPTVIHEFVEELPFLGCLIIGLTIVRLLQRKKSLEKEEQ